MTNRKRQPTHPGEILKRHYMAPLKLTVSGLAEDLRVSRKTISKIINGRGSVTPDMALRLSVAFETSAELWLNLQMNYDLWNAASNSKEWETVKTLVSA